MAVSRGYGEQIAYGAHTQGVGMTQPADLKNLTDSEGPEQSRVHGGEQNDDPYQPRSDHCQDDNHVAQHSAALTRPELLQEASCFPHIQSPACRCRMTTRFGILWPIRPATESESRIGPIRRALTRARWRYGRRCPAPLRSVPARQCFVINQNSPNLDI